MTNTVLGAIAMISHWQQYLLCWSLPFIDDVSSHLANGEAGSAVQSPDSEPSVLPETRTKDSSTLSQPQTAVLLQALICILVQLLLCVQPMWALLGPNRSSLPNGMTGECRNELENEGKYGYVGRNLARVETPLLHIEMREWQHLCACLPLALSLWLPIILALWSFFSLTCLGFLKISQAIPDWVPKSKCMQWYLCKSVSEDRASHSAPGPILSLRGFVSTTEPKLKTNCFICSVPNWMKMLLFCVLIEPSEYKTKKTL